MMLILIIIDTSGLINVNQNALTIAKRLGSFFLPPLIIRYVGVCKLLLGVVEYFIELTLLLIKSNTTNNSKIFIIENLIKCQRS